MVLRKNSLAGLEKRLSLSKGKKNGLRPAGLSRIQAHIDMVKGKSPDGETGSLRRMEQDKGYRGPSALKFARGFDHSSVSTPSLSSHAFSVHPLSVSPVNDAFSNVDFSAEVEAFEASYGRNPYGYGPGGPAIAFDDGQSNLGDSLPEHERPYRSAIPSKTPSPEGQPSTEAAPQHRPSPAPCPESEPVKQEPTIIPLPQTAAAMSAFERDIDRMISTAKQRGDSPAVRQDTKEKAVSPSSLSRESESHPHDIFEKMGRSLQFANSFDIGSVDVVKKFDRFDRELGITPGTRPSPQKELFFQMGAQDLTDTDIALDLAEIDMIRQERSLDSGFASGQAQAPDPPSDIRKENISAPGNNGEKPSSSPAEENRSRTTQAIGTAEDFLGV